MNGGTLEKSESKIEVAFLEIFQRYRMYDARRRQGMKNNHFNCEHSYALVLCFSSNSSVVSIISLTLFAQGLLDCGN